MPQVVQTLKSLELVALLRFPALRVQARPHAFSSFFCDECCRGLDLPPAPWAGKTDHRSPKTGATRPQVLQVASE